MNKTKLILAMAALLLCGQASADDARQYHIPAQSLNNALLRFSADSGVETLYAVDKMRGLNSNALEGSMTPAQALSQLLQGSGMTYRFVDAKTVTVEQAPTSNNTEPQSGGDTTLPKVTVEADADKPYDDPNWANDPYNTDYNRPNATTATKTDTPIMETPVSIQVVPKAVMNDQQAIRLEDVAKNVSGVVPGNTTGSDFSNEFIVRGFNLNSNIYRNGFRINNFQSETANLQSLEVLKGAAAMLYGRIEPGGMLNLVTKKPLDTPYYALQQQFGSYDLYRTTLDATGPVPGNDALLYRFNLAYQNNNSFRDFINAEHIFIAPSLTWKATESTQFNVNMEYRHGNSSDDFGVPAVGRRPAPIPISRNLGEPNTNRQVDAWLVEFTGSHAFNEDWKLKGGVNANSIDNVLDDVTSRLGSLIPDAQGNPERILERGVFFGPNTRDSQGVYLDLNGHFDTFGMKHNVLFGGDYYFLEDSFAIFTNQFSPIGCPIDIFSPTYGCVDFPLYRSLAKAAPDWNNRNEEQWGGIYFQDQITLWEKLHILGGGRYDWASTSTGTSAISLADVKLTEVNNARFSPRVGVTYQPWQWLSLYGNYSESLGSANGTSTTGQPFAPQTATQYEGGIKLAWENLTASLAYYHLTKDNILTTDASTGLSVPIGTQRSQGIEFDASGQVTDQLSLIASYAFTDARFTKANVGVTGNRVNNVPEHQASFWAKYDITRHFSVGTGVFMAGQREGNAANNFQLPGYARWDAMAAYKWDIGKNRLTAQVNVNNILDKEYYSSAASRLRIFVGEPLSVLGSLKFEY